MSTESWVLAIDFGTSYTVAASRLGDRPAEVIEIDGERRVPSIILLDESGEIIVGRAAETLASTTPGRVLRAPKSRLGEPAPVVLGGRPHSISNLVASLLRYVYDAAVRYHGSDPSEVRLTHPATWSGPRRQQLLDAAEAAGIIGATLVPEPVAAAIAYADDVSIPQGGHVVVYDLGGGTFDTAALQASPNGFIVMGRPGGDPRLGGELFDELLANAIGESLDPAVYEKLQLADDQLWTQAAIGLRREARRVKEALSSHPYADVLLGLPDGLIQQRIEQAELHRVIGPYIAESVDVMQQTAAGAGLTADDIASIYLVGGASRTPLVEELVSQAYPSVAISRRGDPKGVVAVGATHPLATPTSLAQRSSLDRASTLETPAPPPPAGPAPAEPASPTVADGPGTVADSGDAVQGTVVESANGDNATVVDTSQFEGRSNPATRIDSAVGSPPKFALPGGAAAAASGQRAELSTRNDEGARKTKVAVGIGAAGLLLLGGIGLSLRGGRDGSAGAPASSTVTTVVGGGNNGSVLVIASSPVDEPDPPATTTIPVTTAPPDTVAATLAPNVIASEAEAAAALLNLSDVNALGWVEADPDELLGQDGDGFCGPEPVYGLVSEVTSALQNANGTFRILAHTIDVYDSAASADQTFREGFAVYAGCTAPTAEVDGTVYDLIVFAEPLPSEDTSEYPCADDTAFIGTTLTNDNAAIPELSQFVVAIRCGSNVSVITLAAVGSADQLVDQDFGTASALAVFRLNNLPGSH